LPFVLSKDLFRASLDPAPPGAGVSHCCHHRPLAGRQGHAARLVFADKPYVTLEDPEERAFADTAPRRFLMRFPNGAILDEIQRCPDLLSCLQGLADERRRMGDFVLTGSQQFGLLSNIPQSLAGRDRTFRVGGRGVCRHTRRKARRVHPTDYELVKCTTIDIRQ
jgi:hypothetical protein